MKIPMKIKKKLLMILIMLYVIVMNNYVKYAVTVYIIPVNHSRFQDWKI